MTETTVSEESKLKKFLFNRLQLGFFASCAALIYLHYYVYNWFFKMSLIGGQSYNSSFITLQGLSVWRNRMPLVWICAILILGSWRISWKKLQLENSIRWLITICALIFAWKFSSYDYNLYFDQAHLADRAILLLLGCCVYLHPAFLAVFLFVLYPMVFQMESPLGLYSWTDKYIPLNILTIFVSFSLLSVFKRLSASVLLFTVLCMTGAYYLYPGIGKMNMGPHWYTWMLENPLPNLIISSWLNGWAWFVSEENILKFANFFSYVNVPSLIATMIIELGVVFFLVGRKTASFFLASCIVLHMMILISSGIFFWKWIIADAALIGVLWTLRQDTLKALFTPLNAIAAFLVIVFGNHYFDVIELGWLDSRINHMYEFEVTDRDNQVFDLGRDFFSPYDLTFSQNRFYNLEDEGLAASTFGSVYRYDEFLDYQGDYEERYQANIKRKRKIDPRRAEVFDLFIKKFFVNWNKRRSKSTPFSLIKAPQHIYMKTRKRNFYDGKRAIKGFKVRLVQTYYDGEKIHILKDEVIRKIKIPRK